MAPAVPLAFAAAPVAVHGGVRPQHVRQPDKTALLLVIQALVERRSPLGQKIEAVGNRSIRRSLVGRRAVIGNMQQSRTSPFLYLAVANYTRKTRRSFR